VGVDETKPPAHDFSGEMWRTVEFCREGWRARVPLCLAFEQGRGRVSPPSRNVPVGGVVEVVVGGPLRHLKRGWVGWWWWENTLSHDSSEGGVYSRHVSPLSLET